MMKDQYKGALANKIRRRCRLSQKPVNAEHLDKPELLKILGTLKRLQTRKR